jgi:hypothetical protein
MTTQEPFALDVLSLAGFSAESWNAPQLSETALSLCSRKTTDNKDLLTLILPLYSMKPRF